MSDAILVLAACEPAIVASHHIALDQAIRVYWTQVFQYYKDNAESVTFQSLVCKASPSITGFRLTYTKNEEISKMFVVNHSKPGGVVDVNLNTYYEIIGTACGSLVKIETRKGASLEEVLNERLKDTLTSSKAAALKRARAIQYQNAQVAKKEAIRAKRLEIGLAFACATHARLGDQTTLTEKGQVEFMCPARDLDSDAIRLILGYSYPNVFA